MVGRRDLLPGPLGFVPLLAGLMPRQQARLAVVPLRALLHRDADPDSPEAAKGCLHDCVVFSLPASVS